MCNKRCCLLVITCLLLLVFSGCTSKKDDQEVLQKDILLDMANVESSSGDSFALEAIKEVVPVVSGEFECVSYLFGELSYQDVYCSTIDADGAQDLDYKVQEGDEIKEGDVIMTYRIVYNDVFIQQQESEIEQQEREYSVGLSSRRAEISQAKHELSTMKNSFDKRIQQAEIDKLNLALEKFKETEIDIIKARDEFESYKESLFTTEVRASCDGLVLALNKKEEDDYYYKGEWVAKITPRDEYYICVKEVAEGLSYGEMVSVVVYGENEEDKVTIPGVVISADNILSVENHQSLTYIKLLQDTKDVEWRESIRVYYKSVSLKDVLLLPIRAVQFESLSSGAIAKEIPFVYLYNKDGSVSKRYIEIERDDQANYWVTRGLEIGQQVAVY